MTSAQLQASLHTLARQNDADAIEQGLTRITALDLVISGLEGEIASHERQKREVNEQVLAVQLSIADLRAEIEREAAAYAPCARYEQDIVEAELVAAGRSADGRGTPPAARSPPRATR